MLDPLDNNDIASSTQERGPAFQHLTHSGSEHPTDMRQLQVTYPDLRRSVKEQYLKHSPNTVLIEDKGSGTALLQDLRGDGLYCLKAYCPPPGNDKEMRLFAQASVFENGRVWLPQNAPWLAEYLRELTCFPGTKHDDQVDSTTQALHYLGNNNLAEMWARLGR
jgi:predicted phage terminase large subunit-like protein